MPSSGTTRKRSRSRSDISSDSKFSPDTMSPVMDGPESSKSADRKKPKRKKTKRARKASTDVDDLPYPTNEQLNKITVLDKFVLDELIFSTMTPPATVINKRNIINDSFVQSATTLAHNPYLIHYEEHGGKPYPIITIPQGTMLFNGRTRVSYQQSESFSHLYKVHGHDTLQSYIDDLEQTYTYFFPIPYMINVIDSGFQTIDTVTLTKDIRLLALISPSPIGRAIRHEGSHKLISRKDAPRRQLYDATNFYNCANRDYDLCVDPALLKSLQLNGYIGIAGEDGMHVHYKKIDAYMNKKLDKSQLFRACTFNNGVNEISNIPPSNSRHPGTRGPGLAKSSESPMGYPIVDFMKKFREYGIPEIVLIPLDIHKCTATQYESLALAMQPKNSSVNSEMFVFKSLYRTFGPNTYDLTTKLDKYLTGQKGNIVKSLQAPYLFNLWRPEVGTGSGKQSDALFWNNPKFTGRQVNFSESYVSSDGSNCCAFEMMALYTTISKHVNDHRESIQTRYDTETRPVLPVYEPEEGEIDERSNQLGGETQLKPNIKLKQNPFVQIKPRRWSTANKKKVTANADIRRKTRYIANAFSSSKPYDIKREFNISEVQDTDDVFEKPIISSNTKFYYSETSGIPVIFLKKSQTRK